MRLQLRNLLLFIFFKNAYISYKNIFLEFRRKTVETGVDFAWRIIHICKKDISSEFVINEACVIRDDHALHSIHTGTTTKLQQSSYPDLYGERNRMDKNIWKLYW